MAVLEYSKELQVQTAAGAERESMLWSVYTSTKMSINTNIAAICMTVTRRSSSFLRDDRYRHFNNLLPHSSMSTFPFLYLFNQVVFVVCLLSSIINILEGNFVVRGSLPFRLDCLNVHGPMHRNTSSTLPFQVQLLHPLLEFYTVMYSSWILCKILTCPNCLL